MGIQVGRPACPLGTVLRFQKDLAAPNFPPVNIQPHRLSLLMSQRLKVDRFCLASPGAVFITSHHIRSARTINQSDLKYMNLHYLTLLSLEVSKQLEEIQ